MILLQTTSLFLERSPIARYDGGIYVSFSCFAAGLVLFLSYTSFGNPDLQLSDLTVALLSTQGALLAVIFLSSLSIKRRPDLFVNGRRVDGQYTASVWDKYTFIWTWPTLSYARKNKELKLEDVPLLANRSSSQTLLETFHRSYKFKRLWMRVLWFSRWGLLSTTFLISFAALLQFGPQLAMLNILSLMEQRTAGEKVTVEAYFWVVGLGLSMTVSTFLETWMFWIVEARLGIPGRGLLSALIFEKATRRKNSQDGHKKKVNTASQQAGEGEEVIVNEAAGREDNPATHTETAAQPADTVVAQGEEAQEDKKGDKEEDDEDGEAKKTRQGVINLIAVDTQRFQFFITYSYLYPNILVKLVVSITFLVKVVGWIPLLAGLAAFSCTLPFNIFLSKRFVGKSNDLMKFRDQKLASITEALQGIRQIKYSAIEQQWQDRIAEKRRQELKTQKAAFLYDVGLIVCWISGQFLPCLVEVSTQEC